VTSRGEGAHIGGGFLLLAGPLFIAGLLHLALSTERRARCHMVHTVTTADHLNQTLARSGHSAIQQVAASR